MNAEPNPERHTTVPFAVALATSVVLVIFAAVIVMFVREGLPVERLAVSWLAEQESKHAANTAAMPRDLSSQPINVRP
jgi:hypothetical protein